MTVNFYQLNCTNSASIQLVNIGFKTQGTCRAVCFLSCLSKAIYKGLDTHTSIEELDKVVSDIQINVERKKLYALMSWIPLTKANLVSKLIKRVKNQVEQLKHNHKQIKLKELHQITERAKNNYNNWQEYFIASDKLNYLIAESKDSGFRGLKPNQFMLFYSFDDERRIVYSPMCIGNNRGRSNLVSFIVEFEPTNKSVKILGFDSKGLHEKYYQNKDGEHIKITKQELFNILINL
jgi:hypothetical protein